MVIKYGQKHRLLMLGGSSGMNQPKSMFLTKEVLADGIIGGQKVL